MFSFSLIIIAFKLASSLAMALPMPYGSMIGPYYPGMMAKGVMPYPFTSPVMYQNNMGGGQNYYGGNQGFAGYANDGISQDIVRDKQQVINQGAQGVNGNHMVMKNNEEGQGYERNVAGANYKQGGDGYMGAQKQHDTSSRDGYGGFGTNGHRKGHKTTGFHKSYHNVESGKDSKFVDEDHNVGEENFGKEFGNNFDDRALGGYEHGRKGGEFGENMVNRAGGGGGMKSVGVQGSNWDARDHNGYTNNRDLAYQRAHMQSNRKNDMGMGHAGGHAGSGGSYYVGPHMG